MNPHVEPWWTLMNRIVRGCVFCRDVAPAEWFAALRYRHPAAASAYGNQVFNRWQAVKKHLTQAEPKRQAWARLVKLICNYIARVETIPEIKSKSKSTWSWSFVVQPVGDVRSLELQRAASAKHFVNVGDILLVQYISIPFNTHITLDVHICI